MSNDPIYATDHTLTALRQIVTAQHLDDGASPPERIRAGQRMVAYESLRASLETLAPGMSIPTWGDAVTPPTPQPPLTLVAGLVEGENPMAQDLTVQIGAPVTYIVKANKVIPVGSVVTFTSSDPNAATILNGFTLNTPNITELNQPVNALAPGAAIIDCSIKQPNGVVAHANPCTLTVTEANPLVLTAELTTP